MVIRLRSEEKLSILRRLDRTRKWHSLDDHRFCVRCQQKITGRQIDVIGGTRRLGRLRLICPTENCPSMPEDWVYPKPVAIATTAAEIPHHGFGATLRPI